MLALARLSKAILHLHCWSSAEGREEGKLRWGNFRGHWEGPESMAALARGAGASCLDPRCSRCMSAHSSRATAAIPTPTDSGPAKGCTSAWKPAALSCIQRVCDLQQMHSACGHESTAIILYAYGNNDKTQSLPTTRINASSIAGAINRP